MPDLEKLCTQPSGRRRKGAALVLTLFTVAILLTLGTSYIAMTAHDRNATKGDRVVGLAREGAIVGVNFALSYMADPNNWGSGQASSSGTFSYALQSSPYAGGTWLGYGFTFTPLSNQSLGNLAGLSGSQISITKPFVIDADVVAGIVLNIYSIAAASPGHPEEYVVESACTLYANPTPGTAPSSLPKTPPLASRTVYARTRQVSATDFTMVESNARTWDLAGVNMTNASGATGGDGKVDLTGVADAPPSPASPQSPPAGAAQAVVNQYLSDMQKYNDRKTLYDAWKSSVTTAMSAIGVADNFTMKGDVRLDGMASGTGSKYSGTLQSYATNPSSVKYQGTTSLNFGASDASHFTTQEFQNANPGMTLSEFGNVKDSTQPVGLPQAANSKYQNTVAADGSVGAGMAYQWTGAANTSYPLPSNSNEFSGYIKASTPPTGAVGVDPSSPPANGAAVEYDKSGANSQPGFAKTIITFNADGTLDISQVGAYSGKPIPNNSDPHSLIGSTGSRTGVPISSIHNGIIYVDGGNVEVKGTISKDITISASASTDRPTVTNDGSATATRINYDTATIPTSIYKTATDPIFATGQVPAQGTDGKMYWPAWDPKKYNPDSTNPILANMDPYNKSALTREGNISITGDIQRSSTTPNVNVGLVAQNNVVLNDQDTSKLSSSQPHLQVDATLMSTQRSVQYAGLLPQTNTTTVSGPFTNAKVKDYFNSMGYPNISPPVKGSDGHSFKNGKVDITGSIISPYADVEATEPTASNPVSYGYTTQNITTTEAIRNNPPPCFPQYDRHTSASGTSYLQWVIVLLTDKSAASL